MFKVYFYNVDSLLRLMKLNLFQERGFHINLNSFATVVDSIKYKTYMDNFGEFFKNQIENASAIILSRSQKLSDEKLDICVKEIKKYNNKASIITTP